MADDGDTVNPPPALDIPTPMAVDAAQPPVAEQLSVSSHLPASDLPPERLPNSATASDKLPATPPPSDELPSPVPTAAKLPEMPSDQLPDPPADPVTVSPAVAPAVTDDDVLAAWISQREQVYITTRQSVAKRRQFEDRIRRPYFHAKPLGADQLLTW